MRVVSQNRTVSFEFERCTMFLDSKSICVVVNGGKTIYIGEYNTRERATEIFQDIHEYVEEFSNSSYASVYYMPKE